MKEFRQNTRKWDWAKLPGHFNGGEGRAIPGGKQHSGSTGSAGGTGTSGAAGTADYGTNDDTN